MFHALTIALTLWLIGFHGNLPLYSALVAFCIIRFFHCRLARHLRCFETEAKTALNTHFSDVSSGIAHIRCFRWQEMVLSTGMDLLDRYQKLVYFTSANQQWLKLSIHALEWSSTVYLIASAIYTTRMIQPEGVSAAFIYAIYTSPDVSDTIVRYNELETHVDAFSRLRSFATGTAEEIDGDGSELPNNWPRRGRIRIKNITVKYK